MTPISVFLLENIADKADCLKSNLYIAKQYMYCHFQIFNNKTETGKQIIKICITQN